MGLFSTGDSRPKVTAMEMKKKVMPELSRGENKFTPKERARVKDMLNPLLEGKSIYQRGIDKDELDRSMATLKTNPKAGLFSNPKKADKLEKILRKKL